MPERTTERMRQADAPGQTSAALGQSRRPDGPPAAGTTPFRSYLTARGALLAMFGLCLATCLVAAWRQLDVLAGLGFFVACTLGPILVRREALLAVVTAPPAIFLLAVLVTQGITAPASAGHGSLLAAAEGALLTLAAVAPWLFSGTAACVLVAMFRGLPQCVRDFRAALRG